LQPRFPKLGSIRSKFILSLAFLSVVPLVLLTFVSYRLYLEILEQNVRSYTREVIDRIDRNLTIYLSDQERMLDLRSDYYVLQFVKLSVAGDIEGNRKYTLRLWENFNNIKTIKTDLRDVAITTLNGVRIGCYGTTHIDLTQDQLFQTLANRSVVGDTTAFWGPHSDWLGGSVFSIGRAIRGDYENFLGMMSVDVDVELLDNICRDIRLGKTGYVMLVDENGQIIYHPNPELTGKSVSLLLGNSAYERGKMGSLLPEFSHGNQVVTIKTFTPANWRIIGISNQAELMQEMHRITGVSLLLICGSILAVIGVAIFLARRLTRPIMELRHTMRLAAEDLNTNVTIRTGDEIGQLGEAFNQMLARIRQLMEQSVQEQKKLRRTEMIALQEQIKPHFIYNTLDLIIGLLETKQNEDVINMVEALGAFFRISLSHGQEFITIREETEHVRNYLYIQRFRHGDKYNYRFELDERILPYKTIKLILQPLVENAIYHGVRESEEPGVGMIIIRGYFLEDAAKICLEVIDNGVGIPSLELAEINECLREPGTDEDYFGLCNVKERLVLAFGSEYGLELFPTPGGGVTVRVLLPVIQTVQKGSDDSGRIITG
jgi:two-component system sensor histidine kinase YesM